MENKETIITINAIVEKKSKAEKLYWAVDTNQGVMTCFEQSIVDELRQLGNGVPAKVLIAVKGNFSNIRKILGYGMGLRKEMETFRTANMLVDETPIPVKDMSEARRLKDISIYTSYAKDIFCCMLEQSKVSNEDEPMPTMATAIELVKQAKESFTE